jgi:hypothetical protein
MDNLFFLGRGPLISMSKRRKRRERKRAGRDPF